MTKQEVQLISFKVIASAGEAFDHFVKAVNAAKEKEFSVAQDMMNKGNEALIIAHKEQTDLINAEVNDEEIPFSILLIHAQDHFMHATTYQQNAKDAIEMYKVIYNSLKD